MRCSISAKISLEDMKRMLFTMKDKVFKRQFKFISQFFDTNALEDLLKRTVGMMTMDTIKKPKYHF
jgi:hypothetical protein